LSLNSNQSGAALVIAEKYSNGGNRSTTRNCYFPI
jgi:hypothetical protein